MERFSDDELLQALNDRLEDHRNTIANIGKLMIQLEMVNKKLLASESLKTNFLSNIRNEIYNPLSVLFGFAKTLMHARDLDIDEVESIGHTLFKESFILQFQFENIFVAADLEAGDCAPTPSQIDLEAFLKSLSDNYQHLLDEKSQTISISSQTSESQYFVTDPEKFYLILSNLLDNAIKFSESNSHIELVYKFADHQLIVSLVDQGKGIPEKDYQRIFDRFVQLDTGPTKAYRGHGLGLSVVKELVKLMEGDITVTSTVGKGSQFTISIPPMVTALAQNMVSVEGNEELYSDDVEMF